MDPEGTGQPLQVQPQTASDPTPRQEQAGHAPGTSAIGDNAGPGGSPTRPQTSSTERQGPNLPSEAHLTLSHTQSENFERVVHPRHVRSHDGHVRMSTRRMTINGGLPAAPLNGSGIDWIVPIDEKSTARLTVGERLDPTIKNAEDERNKYARKVMMTGYALNTAIGMQVLLGALTTAIAAAATTIKQAQISAAILGALSTLVASYLARARGSGEPDLSILRVKDLESFLRKAKAFQLDHAHEYPSHENHLGEELDHLRRQFEELLGNASGERKLSPVGITTSPPPPPA